MAILTRCAAKPIGGNTNASTNRNPHSTKELSSSTNVNKIANTIIDQQGGGRDAPLAVMKAAAATDQRSTFDADIEIEKLFIRNSKSGNFNVTQANRNSTVNSFSDFVSNNVQRIPEVNFKPGIPIIETECDEEVIEIIY